MNSAHGNETDGVEQKGKRRVTFSDHDVVREFATREAELPLWLSLEDYPALRQRCRDEADALKLEGYGILLKNSFDQSFSLSQKYLDAFAKLPEAHCLRGCEVHVSKQHREARDHIIRRLTKAVLRQQKTSSNEDIATPSDALAEKLGIICKKASRGSRIFARRIGLADQRAVREGDDLAIATSIVKELNLGNAKMAKRKSSVQTNLASMTSMTYRSASSSLRVNQEFGRPSSNISSSTTSPRNFLPNTGASPGAKCASVISAALGVLEDMDGPFTQINIHRSGVAKSA